MASIWPRFVLGFVALIAPFSTPSRLAVAKQAAEEAIFCYANTSLAGARDTCKGVTFDHLKINQAFGPPELRSNILENVIIKVEIREMKVARIAISVVYTRSLPPVMQPFHTVNPGDKDFENLVKLLRLDK